MCDRAASTTAFTLIELLVTLAIIAVLAGMLLPALGAVREAARAAQCTSNLRQAAAAVDAYANDWDGMQVPCSYPNGGTATSLKNWTGLLGPYLGLAEELTFFSTTADLRVMACPSSPKRFGYGYNYEANSPFVGAGVFAVQPRGKVRRSADKVLLVDSTATAQAIPGLVVAGTPFDTFLAWRAYVRSGSYANPEFTPYFVHQGRSNVLWVDGHVEARRVEGFVAAGDTAVYNAWWKVD